MRARFERAWRRVSWRSSPRPRSWSRFDSMQLEQIDPIEAQAPKAAFEAFAQPFRSAVHLPSIRPRPVEAAFGRDHQPGRIRKERFSDELFADVRSVGLRGVDQIHT